MMNKQMFFWLTFVVLGVILGLPSVRASEKHVEIACTSWQPYCGEELPYGGIFSEIVTEAYARKGYSVRYKDMPWARVLKSLKNGELIDAAACTYYTEERNQTYLFSAPVMQSGGLVFYKRKEMDLAIWKTLDDLREYRIGVHQGTAYTPEFDQAEFLDKEGVSNGDLNFKKLLLNRIDLTPVDPAFAHYYIQRNLPEQKDDFAILSPPLNTGQPVYLMFSRAIPDVQIKIQALNEGLKEIREDGTLNEILKKHGLSE